MGNIDRLIKTASYLTNPLLLLFPGFEAANERLELKELFPQRNS